MTPILLTGRLRAPDGSPLAGAALCLVAVPYGVALGADAVLPGPVTVTADAQGDVAVTIYPGRYVARITDAEGQRWPAVVIDLPGAAFHPPGLGPAPDGFVWALMWTGTLRFPSGAPAASATATFAPDPFAVAVAAGSLTVPRGVSAETDASGALVVELLPGTYAVRVVAADGRWFPTFHVEVPGDWLTAVSGEPVPLFDSEGAALFDSEGAALAAAA
jgi:hypothetical protein